MPLLDFFPLKSNPRPGQVKALDFIHDAVQRGIRDIILACPCGSGKSMILQTVCYWAAQEARSLLPGDPGGYYLTAQKLLQAQLEADRPRCRTKFDHLASLKSAVEYPCAVKKCCGNPAKVRCPAVHVADCPYKLAKWKFLTSTVAITNYAYMFHEHQFCREFPPRQVLALDECHNLERLVSKFIEVRINEKGLDIYAPAAKPLPPLATIEEFFEWAGGPYLAACRERLLALEELAKELDSPPSIIQDAVALRQHVERLDISLHLAKVDPDAWVYWEEFDEDTGRRLTLRPLDISPFTPSLVFDLGSLRLYSSAFPGDQETFCRSLGLDPKNTAWLSLGSDFPVKNRRILVADVGSLGRTEIKTTLPRVIKSLSKILDKHAHEKGLIHGHSYLMCREIAKAISAGPHADRLIFPQKSADRAEAFKTHVESPDPTILLTPSMTEGFDFFEDRARFQVIVKCPWPSLSDQQVKVKSQRDPTWYKIETVKSLTQSAGRICRSETDKGVTYLLDSDYWRLESEVGDLMPDWFKESVIDVHAMVKGNTHS